MVSLDNEGQSLVLKRLNVELGKDRENILVVKNRILQDQKVRVQKIRFPGLIPNLENLSLLN